MQFIHWFLSMSGESPTKETAQKQSAFLSPPPQVSQPGSPCTGNFYLYASPQGTAISDKCKETVALLQYSLWQFSLKPTFLSLISIVQGNYKEKVMVRCGKREARKNRLGNCQRCGAGLFSHTWMFPALGQQGWLTEVWETCPGPTSCCSSSFLCTNTTPSCSTSRRQL